jgi:hypothetical protein
VSIAESGVHVYLMHLDNEEGIKEFTDGTPLKFVSLYG